MYLFLYLLKPNINVLQEKSSLLWVVKTMATSVTIELSGLIIYGSLASEKMFCRKLSRNLIRESCTHVVTHVLTFSPVSYTRYLYNCIHYNVSTQVKNCTQTCFCCSNQL